MWIFQRHTPRWLIFFIDIFICIFSLTAAYLLRFNFVIPEVEADRFYIVYPFAIAVRAFSFYLWKTYQGMVRYTSSRDAQRIFMVTTIGSLFLIAANLTNRYLLGNTLYVIPFSIVVIDYLVTTFLMISLRIMFKALYFELKNPGREKRSVIIYGAGESGVITKRTLDRDAGTKYNVIAFLDDDKRKAGKSIEGVPVFETTKLEELLRSNDVAHLVISIQQLSPSRKEEVVDRCLAFNTKVLNVPPVSTWINGELSFRQIKKVRIEELLERNPIQLDQDGIKKQFSGKTILVTGAAGSIGSELVRQLLKYSPARIVMLDNAESPLNDCELETKEKLGAQNTEAVIADVRNEERMRRVFLHFKPSIVFHAAAYKHVPMMETNPSEAVYTNIHGTKMVADLSVQYGVEKFVMISTDKAVNPTSIMGASKRVAEIYTQSLGKTTTTRFITTRFGNVLGSNGSVIPRFRRQIEEGGPVTVTHPDITRFFMTIAEACQLVLEAAAMGKGGEIFIFDMGKPIRIADLAKKMIQLSGLGLDKDIRIVYTGLRPGEKLYEELLNTRENTLPTHHAKIMIAKVQEYDTAKVTRAVNEIISLYSSQQNEALVSKMKALVPEYKSRNSVYEMLD